MKISDSEKLILLMLSDLYDSGDVKGKIDQDFIRSAITDNMEWSIPWKYDGFTSTEQDAPEIVKEVMDILDMWRAIEDSYAQLSENDKTILKTKAEPFGDKPKFKGFDGNNEYEYRNTALFLVNKLDKYEEFKGRNFNSHCRSIDIHLECCQLLKKFSTHQTSLLRLMIW